MPRLVFGHLIRGERTWPHQAHLAFQHVHQLRQFVQAAPAQDSPHPSHTGIVGELERGAVRTRRLRTPLDVRLYVGLMQEERQWDEGITMTLWDSYASVRDYQKSGVYEQLLAQMQPYLSNRSDYRINLSDNYELDYSPVEEKPKVASYASLVQKERDIMSSEDHPLLLMRIISLKIQPGKMEEFRKIYSEQIIPALRQVKGCRNAFLSDRLEESNEIISLTVWENKQDLARYIESGLYKKLAGKVRHLYSDLYQWKLAHRMERSGLLVTSEDLKERSYRIVIDKVFRK